MKTSDVELPNRGSTGGSNGSGGGLAAFFNLDWFGKKKKPKKKFKAGTHPSAGGPANSKTKVSQSVGDVLALLAADQAHRVGVFSDREFFEQFRAAAADKVPGLALDWISNDFVNDQPQGAKPIAPAVLGKLDAIVVGGSGDLPTRFRYALRQTHAHAPAVPVHWVAENWEFCAGTAAIPTEIDDVDALVFNHFEEFFGIKDPLQFRFEIIAEEGIKRSYLILGPSQSVNLNLKELAGPRKGPVCIKIHVAHPFLTRGRHYRFRICGDVFWKDSFTIIHGSHQFFKNPNKRQEFRLIDLVVRNGRVIMTVPNYDLDMGENDEITVGSGATKTLVKRSRKRPVELVEFAPQHKVSETRNYLAAAYHGYGTSFWYALEEGFSKQPGKVASIAANHLCRVGVENRDDIAFRPEELQAVAQAQAAGYMINPVCLPIAPETSRLTFGFNFDASNPPFQHYIIRYYGADGRYLGESRFEKRVMGPVFAADFLAQWNGNNRDQAVTALVAPDHIKEGLAPQRLVTTADMVVRHLDTGDQDMTEFQNSWRNLGALVPTLPHWLHPSIGVVGRTNVIGRVRCKDGYRTGVFVANASGNLNYDMAADVEVSAVNHAGRRLSYFHTLPAFGSAILWLDDLLPDLRKHLGGSGIATLQVKSPDADLTAHVIGLSPRGAVGLQHLWGY